MKGGKAALLLALGAPKSKPSKSDDSESEIDMGSESKRSAARDLIDAVKSGDEDAVASAFQSLYDSCAMKGDEDDEDDEDEY